MWVLKLKKDNTFIKLDKLTGAKILVMFIDDATLFFTRSEACVFRKLTNIESETQVINKTTLQS